MRVAINGFGRIGRSVFRILHSRSDVELVAINDLFDPEALAYLLKYDTVMGGFGSDVVIEGDMLKTSTHDVKMLSERNPADLPWKSMDVDVVIEATARHRPADREHTSLSIR